MNTCVCVCAYLCMQVRMIVCIFSEEDKEKSKKYDRAISLELRSSH